MLLVDCPLCDQPSPIDGDALDCDGCGVLDVAPDAEAIALPLAA